MKKLLGTIGILGSLSMSAHAANINPSDTAAIFAKGVYSQLNRETLAQNPKADIQYRLVESKASTSETEIFKVLRFAKDEPGCGIVVYVTNGEPSLQGDIDCGR